MSLGAVAVKLSEFWEQQAVVWFAQAETQFAIRKITNDETKYCNVVSALGAATASRVAHLLGNPPEDCKYETLKDVLLETFGQTESERARQLLSLPGLGDAKPSELMDRMLALLPGDHKPCFLFKELFLQQLPLQVRSALANSHISDYRALAKEADMFFSATQHCQVANVVNPVDDSTPPAVAVALSRTPSFPQRQKPTPTVKRRGRKKKTPNPPVGLEGQPGADGVPGKLQPGKKVSLPAAEGTTDSTIPSVKIEMPPELLKPPKEKVNYHCSVCGKDFPHAYKLDRHALTHTGEKPYCCNICDRGFNQKGNLKTHYKFHTACMENPLEEAKVGSCLRCPVCRKECESLSALQAHHSTTHKQTSAGAAVEEQLEKHIKTHVKEKPYSCPDCGKRFINESYIEVHRLIHTGEKPFLCSQCGKGYHTAPSLKLHETQHTGDRPFACSLCEKKFRIKSYMMAHYQTHTKDRPFLCTVCGKGYARAVDLKVHHRIHTGERPYECSECGKSFIYRQGLRQHRRMHAGRPIGPTRQLGRPKQQARQENLTITQ